MTGLYSRSKGKKNAEDAKNRAYPNIYFSLDDDQVGVGLVCNTLKSIERIRNILATRMNPNRHTQGIPSLPSSMPTVNP